MNVYTANGFFTWTKVSNGEYHIFRDSYTSSKIHIATIHIRGYEGGILANMFCAAFIMYSVLERAERFIHTLNNWQEEPAWSKIRIVQDLANAIKIGLNKANGTS